MINTQRWGFIDFDNTLMSTEQYTVPSLISRFNELYRDQINTPLNDELFKQHFHGQARQNLCDNLSKYYNIPIDYSALYHMREWRIMKHLQYIYETEGGIPMAPHVIETLTTLTAPPYGIQLALVSNNPVQRALSAMRYARNHEGEKLSRLFGTHYFEAGDIQKPKPDIYIHAMSQVNTYPESSFAVEDSITGATAAIKAGIPTFGYTGFSEQADILAEKLTNLGCIDTFQDWKDFPDKLKIMIK
jgi:HAD superfamily hydrolase (TIGR01509 family)